MFRSSIRDTVDSRAPILGKLYRELRDELANARPRRQTAFGFKMAGPPNLFSDNWEVHEIEAFKYCLQSSATCIDIGANVGFYSCYAASLGKHVISVEPLASNLKFLYGNLACNEFLGVEVYPLGLSGTPGLRRLYGMADIASFVPGWGGSTERRVSNVVPVTTLDVIAGARFNGIPLTIKMDVEGFENEVLKGAGRTLALHPKPKWLVEIMLTDVAIPGGINTNFYEPFEVFWRNGYEARQASDRTRVVKPEDVSRWINLGSIDSGSQNFLFVEN